MNAMACAWIVFVIAALPESGLAQQLYRHVDENGKVTFSDRPQSGAEIPQASTPQRIIPSDPQGEALMRSMEAQRPAFAAYQKCVSEHRRAVDLHYAAADLIQYRDNRVGMEAALKLDPGRAAQYPGGIDQILGIQFARYKSLGGTAASLAQVQPVPMPCTPPGQLDFQAMQRPEVAAYQKCAQEHRRELDLYYAADGLIRYRDNPAQFRGQNPGGAEQMVATGFARYKSLGGTAASIAEVQPVANPCPLPKDPGATVQRRVIVIPSK